jgi:hypothetical protein
MLEKEKLPDCRTVQKFNRTLKLETKSTLLSTHDRSLYLFGTGI